MRYVVLVKPPDDHPGAVRIFGTFNDRERADELCERIRADVEAGQEWADEVSGYAYVLPIEKPRILTMRRWALTGEK